MVVGFVGQRWGGVSREEDYPLVVEWVQREFQAHGVRGLYVSSAVGVDLAAMEAAQREGIPFVVVEPFPLHTRTWPLYWAERYERLASQAQDRIVIAEDYYPGVWDARAHRVAQEALSRGGEVWVWWDGYGDYGVARVLAFAPRIRNLGYDWARV